MACTAVKAGHSGVKSISAISAKARKLAYYGNKGVAWKKIFMQGTVPGARKRGRPRTAWMDNSNTWTGLSVEESIKITEERDKRRKYVYGVANRSEDRGLIKNRTEPPRSSGDDTAPGIGITL